MELSKWKGLRIKRNFYSINDKLVRFLTHYVPKARPIKAGNGTD